VSRNLRTRAMSVARATKSATLSRSIALCSEAGETEEVKFLSRGPLRMMARQFVILVKNTANVLMRTALHKERRTRQLTRLLQLLDLVVPGGSLYMVSWQSGHTGRYRRTARKADSSPIGEELFDLRCHRMRSLRLAPKLGTGQSAHQGASFPVANHEAAQRLLKRLAFFP